MASAQVERVTGVVYDDRLTSHYSLWNKDFTEKPQRTSRSVERCRELGLLDRCKRIPVRPATESEILTHHTKKHIDILASTVSMNEEQLKELSRKYDYIYFHQKSYENAKLSLGGVIDLVDEVASGKIRNGMAIVRPPGHHAMKDEFCGYCYFSNVAIATQLVLDKYKLKRILVFDWDIHHGQGTQFKFYNDPRVLFVSIHRYELGSEWPHLRESDYDYIGKDAGRGFTINIPLNEIACGNDEYMSIFFNLLLPIFYEFDPELVLVSAGFDCAIGCPEGEMIVTPACFPHFINFLTPLASGKIALILEGGYNLKSLSESVALSLRALLGDPTPKIAPLSTAKISVVESVLNCIKVLHPYWHSLKYQDLVDATEIATESYPFQGVLHLPPVENVQFNTPETRPEFFPLIQECADVDAIKQIEEYNNIVDGLIKDTSLKCADNKLSIAFDKVGQELCNDLKSRGLWSRCVCLQETLSEAPRTTDCVKASLDSILSQKAQSSVCVVQPCQGLQHQNGTSSNTSTPFNSNLEFAVQYAKDNAHINKTLVVELGSMTDHDWVGLQKDPSVLYISCAWSSAGSKHSPPTSVDMKDTGGYSSDVVHHHVNIFIDEDSVTDGDLLAVVQQIILPLSYEYFPDLVILSWKTPLCGEKAGKELFTPMCMGHIVQLLHGLGQSQMLLLVDHSNGRAQSANDIAGDKADNMDSKLLGESVSILLGEKCGTVRKGLPSESTVSKIKKQQDNLKGYWKMLQYRHPVPKEVQV